MNKTLKLVLITICSFLFLACSHQGSLQTKNNWLDKKEGKGLSGKKLRDHLQEAIARRF